MSDLTQKQRDAMSELVSRGTGINCFEDAELVLEAIQVTIGQGIATMDLVRWVRMLPRVKDRAAALASEPAEKPRQLALINPTHDLPAHMQRSLQPARRLAHGGVAQASTTPLLDPSVRIHQRGRPATGECDTCGETFQMNPTGRPARNCEKHRFAGRPSRPRKEHA